AHPLKKSHTPTTRKKKLRVSTELRVRSLLEESFPSKRIQSEEEWESLCLFVCEIVEHNKKQAEESYQQRDQETKIKLKKAFQNLKTQKSILEERETKLTQEKNKLRTYALHLKKMREEYENKTTTPI